MADCLHMFRGYRVPPETVEQVKQAIIETRGRVDLEALRAIVRPSLKPVTPWGGTSRETAAACAVDSFLFDASRTGLVERHMNGWKFPTWWRARTQSGAACR